MKNQKHILVLEDNPERIAAFEAAVRSLPGKWVFNVWRDAPSFMEESASHFSSTCLISLDHDLNPRPGAERDAGTGVDVARHLSLFPPVCPVLLHSSNHDRVYSMYNELRFAGWHAERVGPLGDNWIETAWLERARALLENAGNSFESHIRNDHDRRVERAMTSLTGLAIGDGIGEMFFSRPEEALTRLPANDLPPGPWFHTDDTEMAISIVEVFRHHGFVQQDSLARRFTRRFELDPGRGYGSMTRIQLREVLRGAAWQAQAASAFGGQGSMGNGGAMRVAPLGAYFGGEPEEAARQAARSAEVTHTHPEGVAGTIAIAVAASIASSVKCSKERFAGRMFDAIMELTPKGRTREGIETAGSTPFETDPRAAGRSLGSGFQVTAPDTVPFTLWCAARHCDNFPMALAASIGSGGDCDTNAAIVGGIVAVAVGIDGIPEDWLTAMEPLRFL